MNPLVNNEKGNEFYLSGEKIENYRKNFGDTLTLGEVLKLESEKVENRYKDMKSEKGKFLSIKNMSFDDIRKEFLSEKRKALNYIKSDDAEFDLNDLVRVIAIKEMCKRIILESSDNKNITIIKKILL